VYATCTFAPEENEAVVDRVLTRFDGALTVEELGLPLPAALPGLTGWGRKTFRQELARARRLIPAPGVEGFFLASLRRQGSPAVRSD
jgi:16S rRNA (cytosine1407-C5)-methyltransferase